ncbi:hypothetical protein JDV02_007004 [Purpureocillium takamizusanense]|uniref:Elongin-A n=1 Tax=Purpureocillium takamizusanense TaxID=2060973 RepID=A0A9Q8QJR0_9HYPO|nr:uncharacterized protein JDV02_007004 [Purpureocillium takamizusanense]UNI20965.1 hypothetical protein JDV02_007004 [Purpureocillium takamizusanense]
MSLIKSLMELATMAAIKNIRHLDSVGDFLPYEAVRTILLRVESAHQLRRVELNSPQIQGHTGEIWIKIIENEFPLEYKATAYKPSSPDKWYKVWEKYKHEHDVALAESEAKLKNALAGLQEDKQRNVSTIVERKYLPRAGRTGPKQRHWSQRDTGSSVLSFSGGSRTKTNTGASVMKKVRREAREIANIKTQLSKPIRAPIRGPTLHKAPAAMVNDHRRAALPQYRVTGSAMEQYEQRATLLSDSDDDDLNNKPVLPVAPPKKTISDAAKVSLLKKRPGTASSTKPIIKQIPVRGSTAASPQKEGVSGAGTKDIASPGSSGKRSGAVNKIATTGNSALAGKLNRSAAINKARPVGDQAHARLEDDASDNDAPARLPTRKTVSPPPGEAGPSSPEEIIASLNAPPAAAPRKRKAPPSVFMKPKKRVH